MHFLGNAKEHERLVEAAFVYHDIGLWTDHELAYLEPSEAVAVSDNQKLGLGLDPDLLRAAFIGTTRFFPTRVHIEQSLRPAVRLTGSMLLKECSVRVLAELR